MPRRRRASGAGPCPATLGGLARAARRRRVRVQVLPRRQRGARVPAAVVGRAGPRAGRGRRDRRAVRSCTPRTPPSLAHAPAVAGPSYADFVALAAADEAEDVAIARTARRGRRARRPGARRAPVERRRAAADRGGPRATGVRVSVETCPHYLTLTAEEVPDGATEFKCCPPIRDRRQPRRAVAGTRRRPDRLRGLRPLALRPPSSRPRHRGLRRRPGAGSPRCSSGCRWCGPRPGPAGCRWPTWCAGWPPRRRHWSGWPARARSRWAPTRTWWRSPRTRRSRVDPARLHHRNPVTPYAGARAARRGARRWLRGQRIVADGEPTGDPPDDCSGRSTR